MTFNPSVPTAEDSPFTSATPIQVNFAEFAAGFSQFVGGVNYNHMPINDTNQGKHAAVLMEKQVSDPGVTQNLTVLFNKNATSAVSTEPQLFAQIPKFLPTNNDTTPAPNDPMQLTYNAVNLNAPIYQSFLVGGYLIYFGATPTATIVTLTPTPTEILTIQIANPTQFRLGVTQPDKFSVNSTGPGSTTWMAIAKA